MPTRHQSINQPINQLIKDLRLHLHALDDERCASTVHVQISYHFQEVVFVSTCFMCFSKHLLFKPDRADKSLTLAQSKWHLVPYAASGTTSALSFWQTHQDLLESHMAYAPGRQLCLPFAVPFQSTTVNAHDDIFNWVVNQPLQHRRHYS